MAMMVGNGIVSAMGVKRASAQPFSIIIVIGLLVALAFVGDDIITLSLRPLKYLGVGFPDALQYAHLIAPAIAFALWIVFGRRWPQLSALAVCLLCSMMISAVANWADNQVEKVKMTAWIDSNDITKLETRLGFKVWEQGDSSGNELWIRRVPGHDLQLITEAKRMGVLQP
jgi:hypothetical protein